VDTKRIRRVKEAMQSEGLDALVCRLPENVLTLSGYWPLVGWSFLLFPRDGEPTCIIPHTEEQEAREELWGGECVSFLFGVLGAGNPYEDIARALKAASAGKGWRRVGYEGSFECIAPPWNAAETAIPANITRGVLCEVFGEALIDATDLLTSQHACKTAAEADKLRIVNEISNFGLRTFSEMVAAGVTGVELVAAVEHAIMTQGTGYKGAKRVRSFAQVATGPAETLIGFRPMEISTLRKIEPGDLALLELGVVADGFWSDRTRVRVAGKPTPQQTAVLEVVKAAQAAAIKKVRAGVTAGEVDEAARAVIRDAGYEKEFVHVTGHGVGLRYHEPIPIICPGSDLVLEPGMVHSVEPGIYIPEMGGIRLEDDVLVTQTGAEVLGAFGGDLA